MKKLILATAALAFSLGTVSASAQQIVSDPNLYWTLVDSLRGRCTATPVIIPGAALAKKMAADSSSSIKWSAFSNERANIQTWSGNFVAQVALGRDHASGQMFFRVYFAPMQVWTPVLALEAPADICQGGSVVLPPPPIVPVYYPSIRFACLPQWTPNATYWIDMFKVHANGWEEKVPQIYPDGHMNDNGVWANNGDNVDDNPRDGVLSTGTLEGNRSYHVIFGRGADILEQRYVTVGAAQVHLNIGINSISAAERASLPDCR